MSHLNNLLEFKPRQDLVNPLIECISSYRAFQKVDSIFVTGFSGIIPGTIVSHSLELPLVIFRKKQESSHGRQIECCDNYTKRTFIIIDDGINTGNTIDFIFSQLAVTYNPESFAKSTCVGLFLYQQYEVSNDRAVEDFADKHLEYPIFHIHGKTIYNTYQYKFKNEQTMVGPYSLVMV